MTTQILFFFLISTGSLLGIISEKIKYENTIPITCMSMVLILFLFGVANRLLLAVYFVLGLSAAAYAVFLFKTVEFLRKNGFKELKNRLRSTVFTPSFVVFILFFAVINFSNFNRKCVEYDEFTHWATVVKQMVEIDAFGTDPGAVFVSFKSYPPAMALFQYFLQKIYYLASPVREFSEWRLYVAYQVLSFSLIMPFLGKLDYKKPWSYLLVFAVLASPFLIKYYGYFSLYVDLFVGILAGAGLAMVFSGSTDNTAENIFVIFCISVLVLSKDVGIFFAAMTAVLFLLKSKSTALKLSAVCAAAIPKVLWTANIRSNGAEVRFSNKIGLSELAKTVSGEVYSYRTEVLNGYGRQWLEPSGVSVLGHKICFLAIFAAVLLLAAAACQLCVKNGRISRPDAKKTMLVLALGSLVYMAGLCVIYMFKFSEAEAVKYASFDRYTGIGMNALLFFSLLTLCGNIRFADIFDKAFVIVLAVLPFLTGQVSDMAAFIDRTDTKNSVYVRSDYDYMSDYIRENVERGSSVCLVVQTEPQNASYYDRICRFNLMPDILAGSYWFGVTDEYNNETPEEWRKELAESYDYVIICQMDEYFTENYSCLFEDERNIFPFGIYRVDKDNGTLTLAI